MRQVPVSGGYTATVDDDDYQKVIAFRWGALRNIGSDRVYARTTMRVGAKKSQVLMHRLVTNAPLGMQVDHINHDTLDNRKDNLRVCTNAQNAHNRRKHRGGSSQYKGVSWDKRHEKWLAQIQVDKKKRCLGYYEAEADAARAYDAVAREHFGEFANTNF